MGIYSTTYYTREQAISYINWQIKEMSDSTQDLVTLGEIMDIFLKPGLLNCIVTSEDEQC